jgi:arginine decarboxylase
VKPSLELHVPQSDTPYHIGFFLVGAYQEALGNNHNLFGAVNELIVTITDDGQIEHLEEVRGEDVGELLRAMNYTDEGIVSGYAAQLEARVTSGDLSRAEADQIFSQVKGYFAEYPYLLVKSRLEIIG